MRAPDVFDWIVPPAFAASTYSGTATSDTLANIAQDQLLVQVFILVLLVVAVGGLAAILGRLR